MNLLTFMSYLVQHCRSCHMFRILIGCVIIFGMFLLLWLCFEKSSLDSPSKDALCCVMILPSGLLYLSLTALKIVASLTPPSDVCVSGLANGFLTGNALDMKLSWQEICYYVWNQQFHQSCCIIYIYKKCRPPVNIIYASLVWLVIMSRMTFSPPKYLFENARLL